MKYIKKFEDNKSEPKIGDYVLVNSTAMINDVCEFISNSIGLLLDIEQHYKYKTIEVEYDNIPMDIKGYFSYDPKTDIGSRKFLFSSIIDYSENREDLEYKIASKKFNL